MAQRSDRGRQNPIILKSTKARELDRKPIRGFPLRPGTRCAAVGRTHDCIADRTTIMKPLRLTTRPYMSVRRRHKSMNHSNEEGVRLEFSSRRPSVTTITDVNKLLAPFGSRLGLLDLRSAPIAVGQLLHQPTLNDTEAAQVKEHFLLSRKRILDLIAEAGRAPQVSGGGEMSTRDVAHDVIYSQLYVVGAGVDYSRFDRFHINVTSDSTGVDEEMQILSGGGVRLLQHLPDEGLVTLHLDCVRQSFGWIVTYNGGYPHISSARHVGW